MNFVHRARLLYHLFIKIHKTEVEQYSKILSLEPFLISFHFKRKMRNRCKDLSKCAANKAKTFFSNNSNKLESQYESMTILYKYISFLIYFFKQCSGIVLHAFNTLLWMMAVCSLSK